MQNPRRRRSIQRVPTAGTKKEAETSSPNASPPPLSSSIKLKEPKKNSGVSSATTLFIITTILLLGTALFLYKNRKDVEKKLTAEKEALIKDFQDIKQKFDIISSENGELKDSLSTAREGIVRYIDSLRKSRINVASLRTYRRKYLSLRRDNIMVLKINDSLIKLVSALTEERNSLVTQLKQQMLVNDSLMQVTESLTRRIQLGDSISQGSMVSPNSTLELTAISVTPISVNKKGKTSVEKKVKKSDKLKICFTAIKDVDSETGDYVLYIKVIDPKGKVLGLNKRYSKISYSLTSKFYYDNKTDLDVCEYLNKGKKKLKSGNYSIIIYDSNSSKIAQFKKKL